MTTQQQPQDPQASQQAQQPQQPQQVDRNQIIQQARDEFELNKTLTSRIQQRPRNEVTPDQIASLEESNARLDAHFVSLIGESPAQARSQQANPALASTQQDPLVARLTDLATGTGTTTLAS